MQDFSNALFLDITRASLPVASEHGHTGVFPLPSWGDLSSLPRSQEALTGALAWGLGCLSVPYPTSVPFGALMMPSEAYGCCPTAAPPGPGQGPVWLPTWPCFVWSALILTPSHLDLTVG